MSKPIKRLPPLSIRLSLTERSELERRAAGTSLSAFIKAALFYSGSTASANNGLALANRTLLAHLLATLGASNLAPNLDRMVHLADSGDLLVDDITAQELRQACDDVRLMHNALMRGLGFKEAQPSRRQRLAVEAFQRAANPEDKP